MNGPPRPRRRRRRLAVAAAATVVILLWRMRVGAEPIDSSTVASVGRVADVHPRTAVLATVRRAMEVGALEAFVREQRQRAENRVDAAEWRVLAEACLERVLLESSLLGMAVGKPTFPDVPAVVSEHLDAGDAAVARARALGDTHSDLPRIEAGLLANRIRDAMTALRHGRRVDALIEESLTREPRNAHALVARGCRLLFAPAWLGGDAKRARELFGRAAEQLADDERPSVFGAFAAFVAGDNAGARDLLRQAVARNPRSRYAAEVLRRLLAGDSDAFARDVARD